MVNSTIVFFIFICNYYSIHNTPLITLRPYMYLSYNEHKNKMFSPKHILSTQNKPTVRNSNSLFGPSIHSFSHPALRNKLGQTYHGGIVMLNL